MSLEMRRSAYDVSILVWRVDELALSVDRVAPTPSDQGHCQTQSRIPRRDQTRFEAIQPSSTPHSLHLCPPFQSFESQSL